jgi:hypothetical protein
MSVFFGFSKMNTLKSSSQYFEEIGLDRETKKSFGLMRKWGKGIEAKSHVRLAV